MRVLLTEGSGLTSRQVAPRLGELGHEVELLSSTALCLARFTRHVRKVHAVPAFGDRPLAWFEAASSIAPFSALLKVQDKVTGGARSPSLVCRSPAACLLPLAAITSATLVVPSALRYFAGASVGAYAVTPEGWAEIQRAFRADRGIAK